MIHFSRLKDINICNWAISTSTNNQPLQSKNAWMEQKTKTSQSNKCTINVGTFLNFYKVFEPAMRKTFPDMPDNEIMNYLNKIYTYITEEKFNINLNTNAHNVKPNTSNSIGQSSNSNNCSNNNSSVRQNVFQSVYSNLLNQESLIPPFHNPSQFSSGKSSDFPNQVAMQSAFSFSTSHPSADRNPVNNQLNFSMGANEDPVEPLTQNNDRSDSQIPNELEKGAMNFLSNPNNTNSNFQSNSSSNESIHGYSNQNNSHSGFPIIGSLNNLSGSNTTQVTPLSNTTFQGFASLNTNFNHQITNNFQPINMQLDNSSQNREFHIPNHFQFTNTNFNQSNNNFSNDVSTDDFPNATINPMNSNLQDSGLEESNPDANNNEDSSYDESYERENDDGGDGFEMPGHYIPSGRLNINPLALGFPMSQNNFFAPNQMGIPTIAHLPPPPIFSGRVYPPPPQNYDHHSDNSDFD